MLFSKKELSALQSWLQTYDSSPHSSRFYSRELERFQEWLINEDVSFKKVKPSHIKAYLDALRDGTEKPTETPRPRSDQTVKQIHTAIRRMFEALSSAGIRLDNPARSGAILLAPRLTPAEEDEASIAVTNWADIRLDYLRRATTSEGDNLSFVRSILLIEWLFWLGLRPSELAQLRTSDLSQAEDGWKVSIKQFGHGSRILLDIPDPARNILKHYQSLQSSPPSQGGEDAPLILSLKSQKAVSAWTITKAVRDLLKDNKASGQPIAALSTRQLKREILERCSKYELPVQYVALHIRTYELSIQGLTLDPARIRETLNTLGQKLLLAA